MGERRSHERYESNIRVEYEYFSMRSRDSDNNSSRLTGKIVNISLGGIFMLSDTHLEPEITVSMFFKKKDISQDRDDIVLITSGTVLRSGHVYDDFNMMKQYDLSANDGSYYAVVKFSRPIHELAAVM